MINSKALLLIPVENQVRELDPKLLLTCMAAERGFSSVIGSWREMEFNKGKFQNLRQMWSIICLQRHLTLYFLEETISR